MIYRAIQRFKNRHVDPITSQIGEAVEPVSDYAQSAQREVTQQKSSVDGFFKRWFESSKKP